MAIARPIRMLAASSVILLLFLIFQLRREEYIPSIGGQGKLTKDFKKDPLLKRE